MKGNMKRVGVNIPGAPDQNPPANIKGTFDRLSGNETTYYDQQLRPGPNLMRPRKRGKRISKMRTGNDAAMALTMALEGTGPPEQPGSSRGRAGKSSMRWFRGLGYK